MTVGRVDNRGRQSKRKFNSLPWRDESQHLRLAGAAASVPAPSPSGIRASQSRERKRAGGTAVECGGGRSSGADRKPHPRPGPWSWRGQAADGLLAHGTGRPLRVYDDEPSQRQSNARMCDGRYLCPALGNFQMFCRARAEGLGEHSKIVQRKRLSQFLKGMLVYRQASLVAALHHQSLTIYLVLYFHLFMQRCFFIRLLCTSLRMNWELTLKRASTVPRCAHPVNAQAQGRRLS
jgi:hypothetical protein